MKIDINQGAPRFRLPPTKMPFTTRILKVWQKLNETMGKDPKISSQYDAEHHQFVLYISEPGFHTTKLIQKKGPKDEKLD